MVNKIIITDRKFPFSPSVTKLHTSRDQRLITPDRSIDRCVVVGDANVCNELMDTANN